MSYTHNSYTYEVDVVVVVVVVVAIEGAIKERRWCKVEIGS